MKGRKRAEASLAKAEQRLQTLLHAKPPRLAKGYGSGDYKFMAEQRMQAERAEEIKVARASVLRAQKRVEKWARLQKAYIDSLMALTGEIVDLKD